MYKSQHGYPSRADPERNEMFSVNEKASDLCHAQPAISTWALELVTEHMEKETKNLLKRESGLRVRATRSNVVTEPQEVGGEGIEAQALEPEVGSQSDSDSDSEDDIPLSTQVGTITELHRMEDDASRPDAPPLTKQRQQRLDPTVSWERINDFSINNLKRTFMDRAPVIWYTLMKIMDPKATANSSAADSGMQYRPKAIVSQNHNLNIRNKS